MGGAGALQGIGGIGLVAIEEMLAIEDRLAPVLAHQLDGIGDAIEVFIERAAQRHMHLIVPGLGDEGDDIRIRIQKTRDARIIGRRAPGALGHAEGGETGLAGGLLAEEFGIQRIGAGIAALHIIDAEIIEHPRDLALVLKGEIDARGLRAIAQGGVEEIEAFAHHVSETLLRALMANCHSQLAPCAWWCWRAIRRL